MRHAPAQHQLGRQRRLDDVDGLARQVVALARRRRTSHEQHQAAVGRKAQVATCLGLRDEPEPLEVEPRGNHMGPRLAVQEGLHMGRHDDRRIGPPRHRAGEQRQQAAPRRQASGRIAQDPLEIVPSEGNDQRQALRQCQESTLTELRVDQVVSLAAQPTLHVEPCRGVAHRFPGAAEPEDIDVDASRPQEVDLAGNEGSGPAPDGGRSPWWPCRRPWRPRHRSHGE